MTKIGERIKGNLILFIKTRKLEKQTFMISFIILIYESKKEKKIPFI